MSWPPGHAANGSSNGGPNVVQLTHGCSSAFDNAARRMLDESSVKRGPCCLSPATHRIQSK